MRPDALPFAGLSPQRVLEAVESVGLKPDGRFFALNSYENRVYQLGTDDGQHVVAKFYRPQRWSDAQIVEEHEFGRELAAAELPVAAALAFEGDTLCRYEGFRFSVFDFQPGHAPELDAPDARAVLGRTLARIHLIGALQPFRYRTALAGAQLGSRSRATVLASTLLPAGSADRYERISGEMVSRIETAFASAEPLQRIRVHGDCHLGNILWAATGPRFVDLDDCVQGPRMQDLWMFLSGDAANQQREWLQLLEGYETFSSVAYSELALIEPLRALRMLNHAAWIAARWSDPAFPRAFPYFGEERFWEQHVRDLAEQLETLDDPPLMRLC